MSNPNSTNPSSSSDMFIFPKDDLSSRVEIPFSFQEPSSQMSSSSQSASSSQPQNQLHSFIKIQNTPTLYLDISDETSQEKLICDALQTENSSLISTLSKCETSMHSIQSENEKLKNELVALKNEYLIQNHQLTVLNDQIQKNERNYINQLQIQKYKLDTTDIAIKTLLSKFDQLEHQSTTSTEISHEDYLNKKFDTTPCDESIMIKNLTKDIVDFAKMNSLYQSSKLLTINQIILNLKELLHMNCDIKIYGSFAYQLALPWSDVDLMIIKNDDETIPYTKASYMTLIQTLFIKLKSATWIASIILVDDIGVLPKIKITTNDNINIFICVVTSVNNNSLIKSVDIVNEFENEYKDVLIPFVLSIKMLLHNALLISNVNNNVNNNGGISSYALTMLIISFLKREQKTDPKRISPEHLGDLLYSFIKYFGLSFDGSISTDNKIFYVNDDVPSIVINYYINAINNGTADVVIIDPCDNKNNLAEKTYRFSNIKLALMIGYVVARDNCECSCHYKEEKKEKEKEHCVLNKIFKTVKRLTNNGNY